MLFFTVLWVPVFETLWKRAVLMLWQAFLFLGLRPVGFILFAIFCLVSFTAYLVNNIWNSLHAFDSLHALWYFHLEINKCYFCIRLTVNFLCGAGGY
jgi:hypothetical protein